LKLKSLAVDTVTPGFFHADSVFAFGPGSHHRSFLLRFGSQPRWTRMAVPRALWFALLLWLREIHQAAQMVPLDLRQLYLERVMLELRGKDLGDGLMHCIAYQVARSITWNAWRLCGAYSGE
jgi:hypothetical protein